MQSNPAPPIGHNHRSLSSSLSASVLFLVFGLLAIVLLSIAIRSNVQERYTWARLEQQGRQVQGKPIELINRRGDRRIVVYEYKVRGKDEIVRTYQRREQVPPNFFNQLDRAYWPGYREVTITVYYLPENPAIARLTADVSLIELVVQCVLGIAAILLFSVMPLGGIGGVIEYLQRERLDKNQERMLYIGIGILVALLLLFIVFPPLEGDMMQGIVSIR